VAAGNRQISLATEDMFVWRTDEAGLPFFVANRSELLDLYRSIIDSPGVDQITLSHATIAPALVDPDLIAELSAMLLDRSSIHNGGLTCRCQRHRDLPAPTSIRRRTPLERGARPSSRPASTGRTAATNSEIAVADGY
jgi:hypothetical protein